jgi:stage III sporulation protein AG
MLILFLSGILIFVILLPTDKSNTGYSNRSRSNNTEKSSETAQTATASDSEKEAKLYKSELEEELEDFLESVSGVGEVKVLIYMKNSQEYVVEKDNQTSDSKNEENSQNSKDESTVYTINDNGDEVPFVTVTKSPSIDGVVVAAQGASDESIRLQIVRLVMALYGIDANKVEVTSFEKR